MEKEKKEQMDKLTELKKIIESMEPIHHPKILEILKTNNIHISSNRTVIVTFIKIMVLQHFTHVPLIYAEK